jgi:prepilin-type N-terminal cleavage/methylation domain-containing protein
LEEDPMNRASKRGFSLLEVLVAMVILAIVMPGLVAMFMGSKRSQVGSYASEQASQFAEGKIDSLRAMGRTLLKPAGSWSTPETTYISGKASTWRWKFDTTAGVAARSGVLTLEVIWKQGGASHSIQLQGSIL